ncbi:MiaB/RimO family radical SAM methylthiotransferase [Glacieibacterium frigidum]|uniref:MiaB/RimO family radical SAM methylthiotransferase n=1 Tax=Glacieibacterium frigidum TaxID=2593303 RepID=A0A552UGG5_9SPHN|nr:MiaB/RimO family radical SAM methylthiotransferase [Glacieibacterium frigidum]TRW17291.1 MiaB/RimO family radical SAM methylthiotransferase [Glacieibacterium frigidum]
MTQVLSFGCRLNIAESAVLGGLVDDPDLVIVNSCAVTAEAVRTGAQAARRAARGGSRVVVTGCAAEVEAGAFAGFATVGRRGKFEASSYRAPLPVREGLRVGSNPQLQMSSLSTLPTPGPSRTGRGADAPIHTRAFVPVQNGCDHACTFCIIARARGPSTSEAPDTVVARIAALHEAGCNEVVLTGVDLTSYAHAGTTLGQLVRRILAETALPRLRLSSIDSIEADPLLLDLIASEPRIMPQLHLSLQAGDDLILKRMRRRHGRDHAIRFCASLRARRPEIAFAADLITGFPTETEAMFEQTAALVDECGLTQLHVFPYSPRPGTPAARMPQVPPATTRDRAARLRALGELRTATALAAQCGRPQRVLVERSGTRGRTEGFHPARVPPAAPGSIVTVTGVRVADGVLECA